MDQAVLRVLSIDGGGVRGYLPALVLAEIERRAAQPIGDLFDLVVGTSTGGIIGIGLATGMPASELADFYPRYGRRIFGGTERSDFRRRLLGPGSTLRESLWMASRYIGAPMGGNPRFGGNARHDADGLETVLAEVLGEARLSQVKTPLALTTFDRLSSMPIVLSSRDASSDPTLDMKLRDAARATSAAPTYFPAHAIHWAGQDREFIDGGVWANNPAGVALSELSSLGRDVVLPESSVVMVSLGTGAIPGTAIFDGNASWFGTATDLAGLATSVWSGEVLASRALGVRYRRFQVLDPRVAGAMNDPSTARLEALREAARGMIHDLSSELDAAIATLVP